MKLKDFIVVTLLGLVGFVISMLGGFLTQLFGTYGIFVHVSLGSFLAAPIYFVMCHRIQKRGSVLIYYIMMGLAYTLMGFLPMLFIMAAGGLLGELILYRKESYEKDSAIRISYILSQLIYALHGFFFILFLGVQGLVDTFPNLFTLEKAKVVENTFFNGKNMLIILSVQIIASYLGTVFGEKVYHKYFSKEKKTQGILH